MRFSMAAQFGYCERSGTCSTRDRKASSEQAALANQIGDADPKRLSIERSLPTYRRRASEPAANSRKLMRTLIFALVQALALSATGARAALGAGSGGLEEAMRPPQA